MEESWDINKCVYWKKDQEEDPFVHLYSLGESNVPDLGENSVSQLASVSFSPPQWDLIMKDLVSIIPQEAVFTLQLSTGGGSTLA